MAKKIVIRHLRNSTLAGRSAEFETETVRIGRREDVQVRFDASRDPLVSGHHAEIKLEGDAVYVQDLGSSNGTFVNGERVARARITSQDRVSLGQAGPEFAVSLVDPAAVAISPTLASPVRPTSAGHSMPPPLAPGPTGTIAASNAPRPASLASQGKLPPAKAGIGMNTLMGVIGKERSSERRRVLAIVASVLLVFACLVTATIFVQGWMQRRDTANQINDVGKKVETLDASVKNIPATQTIHETIFHETTRETVHERVTTMYATTTIVQGGGGVQWDKVFTKVMPGVYVVGFETVNDGVKHFETEGTAWSVKKGYLATNSHVAVAFKSMKAGTLMVARRLDTQHDLHIRAVKLHPGYEAYFKITSGIPAWDAFNARWQSSIPVCDVATLEVEPADIPKQADPLPMATDEELKSVGPGVEIGLVGFPMENRLLGGMDVLHPVPDQIVGNITKVSDPVLGSTSDILYSHNIVSKGGASGSPLFNRDGKVIGLHNSSETRQGGAGFSYGQNVRMLRDLLEGRADAVLAKMEPEWRQLWVDRALDGMADSNKYIFGQADLIFELPGIGFVVDREKWNAESAAIDESFDVSRGPIERTINFKAGSTYFLCYSLDPSVQDFKVEIENTNATGGWELLNESEVGEGFEDEKVLTFSKSDVYTFDQAATKKVRVSGKPAKAGEKVVARLYACWVPIKPPQ